MQEINKKYFQLLSEKYPTVQAVSKEIINLNAILNLPKGTEHFMSDFHGEYESFYHILNNCSGVIKEKVDLLFKDIRSPEERKEICTLIYYPREKMNLMKQQGINLSHRYRAILNELIEIARLLSSKYTRSKVRKALPMDYAYIIDELLHAQKDEDDNQLRYHKKIIDTIIDIGNAEEFIVALSAMIKRLAVDHLHVVGDIFDRGPSADRIIDELMQHHSVDIQWGNHDILWMGAVCGSSICVANVIYNNIKYQNTQILENGYGIALRNLTIFADRTYKDTDPMKSAVKAIAVIMFKLEGQVIKRHPEYDMNDRLLLDKIDMENGTVVIDGKEYKVKDTDFPTVSKESPYELTKEEQKVINELTDAFVSSQRLRKHIEFLYEKGSMYKLFNDNLLFHGCIPLDDSGNFDGVVINDHIYKGRKYMDYADSCARKAFYEKDNKDAKDFMWYLWCGRKSPLSGRHIKTFERAFIEDKSAWYEEKNPYYEYYKEERICNMILREFELYSERSHIINGHTPVRTNKGELPVRAHGKLLVIDGGFCKKYHETTGIAGYTLIFNSHGMRIKAHQPFESIYKALTENTDIESQSELVEVEKERIFVKDTDIGKRIQSNINDLKKLLELYRSRQLVQE